MYTCKNLENDLILYRKYPVPTQQSNLPLKWGVQHMDLHSVHHQPTFILQTRTVIYLTHFYLHKNYQDVIKCTITQPSGIDQLPDEFIPAHANLNSTDRVQSNSMTIFLDTEKTDQYGEEQRRKPSVAHKTAIFIALYLLP